MAKRDSSSLFEFDVTLVVELYSCPVVFIVLTWRVKVCGELRAIEGGPSDGCFFALIRLYSELGRTPTLGHDLPAWSLDDGFDALVLIRADEASLVGDDMVTRACIDIEDGTLVRLAELGRYNPHT